MNVLPQGSNPSGIPAWPSMRGNPRNTGARLFQWDGVPRDIRVFDTFEYTSRKHLTRRLSLINATPVVGPDETIYVGSSDQYFFAVPVSGDPSAWPLGNIVDSAGCFVTSGALYFPCGDYSLYSIASPPQSAPEAHSLDSSGVRSVSTINWFEGNVVADASNRLYAGCDNFNLFCCDGTGGTPFFRWAFPTGFFIWSACAFAPDGRTAYFASADMTCYALDLETDDPSKRERWRSDLGNLCASSPALTLDGRLLVGAFDGKFYGIDAASGRRLWAIDTGSLIYASPAYSDADRRAFVMSSDGVLRAFDLGGTSPVILWEFFTGMPSFSSPAIGPDPAHQAPYLIYVGSGNGLVFALTPDGARRWSYDTAQLSDIVRRYPAINSSIALGNQGVVTATSGGLVLSIPYDGYRRAPQDYTTIPDDDYVAQLPASGLRLCYVSPAGRMAKTLVSPAAPGTDLSVDAQQTLTFAALSRRNVGNGRTRSAFTPLPDGLRVLVDGAPYEAVRRSADDTQLYVDPPPGGRGFELRVEDGRGGIVGIVNCQVAAISRPLTPAEALACTYRIEQMSIAAPFVVPALDQLGIATIQIFLRFLSIDGGVAVAYAYESYASGAANAPRRDLLYVFAGTYADGAFRVLSSPSYFELTGLPVQIDQLTLSGALSEQTDSTTGEPCACTGVSLTASYRGSILKVLEWAVVYALHWLTSDRDAPDLQQLAATRRDAAFDFKKWLADILKRLEQGAAEWFPVVRFIMRALLGGIMSPWKLFNRNDEFFWFGTYKLGSDVHSTTWSPHVVDHSYDPLVRTLTVTVRLARAFTDRPVVGILLFDDTTPEKLPVMLNYVDWNWRPASGADRQSITQKLLLPLEDANGRRLPARMAARVMVDLELAPEAIPVQT